MAKRVSFNALVEASTLKFIKGAAKQMDTSEGCVIDLWALLYNVAGAAGSKEMQVAASNLRTLIRQARDAHGKGKKQ